MNWNVEVRPDSQIRELKLPLTVAAAAVAAGGDDKQDRPDFFLKAEGRCV